MSRNQMLELLLQTLIGAGELPVPAARRLSRMTTATIRRELLMRGLAEYEEPSDVEDDEESDEGFAAYSLLGWNRGPVYID